MPKGYRVSVILFLSVLFLIIIILSSFAVFLFGVMEVF